MNRTHAMMQRGVSAVMGIVLGVTLFLGTSKLSSLTVPEGTAQGIVVGTQRGLPQLEPIDERTVVDELDAGYRPLDEYLTIVDRNPFARFEPRVVAAEGDSGTAKEEEKASFIYRGMASVGSVVRAILEERGSKEMFFVASGGQVGTFKVLDITQDTVILSREDGQEVVIKLAE